MCYDILRSIRWDSGVKCTNCQNAAVVKNGKDSTNIHIQCYRCHNCKGYFDDLSYTIFSGSRQPLHHWITVLYLMNLNASTLQITQELEVSEDTARHMCNAIREGIVKKPDIVLSTDVESDECYIIAGHKGQPQNVKKAGRKPRIRRSKGKRGCGTIEDDKCPVLGLVQRGGLLKLTVIPNVQQKTIKPIIEKTRFSDSFCGVINFS